MDYRALKDFSSSAHGNVSAGQIIEVAPGLTPQWIAAGMIEAIAGKPSGSAAAPSSVSRAGPASQVGSAITYETKPFALSPQIPASKPSSLRPSATDVTVTGGNDTTKLRAPKGSSAGRKTRKQQRASD